MSSLNSRMMRFEHSSGEHRKLTTEDYRNCREHVWAGTLPDHPNLAEYVQAIRKDLFLFFRTPYAASAVDTESLYVRMD